MPTGLGRCSCIDKTQGEGEEEADKFYFVWDSDLLGWAALKPFKTCCGCANLLWTQQPDELKATLSMSNNRSCETEDPFGFTFKLECCQTGQTTFVGCGPDNCDGDPEACSNIFRVMLECTGIPPGRVCDCEPCNLCCSSSAPRWLKVPNPGFSGEGFQDYNLNWYPEHVEGCVWQAGCDGITVTVEHVGTKWRVTFAGAEGDSSSGGGGSVSYEINDSEYICCGTNTLSHTHLEGTPDTVTVKRFNLPDPSECVDPCCSYPDTLYATVTPDGCSGVGFVAEREITEEGTSWTDCDVAMGGCVCPETPIELWCLSVYCVGVNGFGVSLGAPTGSTDITDVEVLSVSPIHLIATGTMACPLGATPITIEVTD